MIEIVRGEILTGWDVDWEVGIAFVSCFLFESERLLSATLSATDLCRTGAQNSRYSSSSGYLKHCTEEGRVVMVVNPYRANDQRARIPDPYGGSSSLASKPIFCAWLSTRMMMLLLLVCITIVSYVVHSHHTIAVDPNVSASEKFTKLRGPDKKNILVPPTNQYSKTQAPSVAPSLNPTPQPTTAVKLTTVPTAPPRLYPTASPTAVPTILPTVLPTTLPTIVPTVAVTSVDNFNQKSSNDAAGHNIQNVNSIEETSEIVKNSDKQIENIPPIVPLAPVNTDSSKPVIDNSNTHVLVERKADEQPDLSEHNIMSKSAYQSLVASQTDTANTHSGKAVISTLSHDEEKAHLQPHVNIPGRLPKSMTDRTSKIPFPAKVAERTNGVTPKTEVTNVLEPVVERPRLPQVPESPDTIDAHPEPEASIDGGLTPVTVRGKYDLPAHITLKVAKADNVDVTKSSGEKIDYCKSQTDPFESQRVESFVPPASAPFDKVLMWKAAVKDVLKNISKLRIGGDQLRKKLQEVVDRLRVLRFQTFCMYAE